MPRGRSTFIGPRLENGQVAGKKPKIKRLPKTSVKRIPIRKIENFANSLEKLQRRGLPKWFVGLEKLSSVEADKRLNNWLNSNKKLLATYQRYLNYEELERKKDIARKGGHTRRLRILENGSSYYSVIQVLTTYGKNCHICNHPIDLKASRRVGIGDWLLGLHIDHLIPIAKGGPDTLENVRPSHAICNLKKGVKFP